MPPRKAGAKPGGQFVSPEVDDHQDDEPASGARREPGRGPQSQATPPAVTPSQRPIGEVRKELSDLYPDAEFDELVHQLLAQRNRFAKRLRETPGAKLRLSVEVTSQTVDWAVAASEQLWPSRRPGS